MKTETKAICKGLFEKDAKLQQVYLNPFEHVFARQSDALGSVGNDMKKLTVVKREEVIEKPQAPAAQKPTDNGVATAPVVPKPQPKPEAVKQAATKPAAPKPTNDKPQTTNTK